MILSKTGRGKTKWGEKIEVFQLGMGGGTLSGRSVQ